MSCAIVDKEERYCEHLANVLYDLGFDVSIFDDEKDFGTAYSDSRFNIVIVSWSMDSLMGENVMETIKGQGEPCASVIVSCDGGSSLSFCFDLRPAGFLFKPFDAERFFEVIHRAMEK
jgi:DNA-binding NtrC family response regulator